jgi:hypothetical protein
VEKKKISERGEIPLRERYVDRVKFSTRGNKWKRCNSSQSGAAVCKCAVCKLLCAKEERYK